MNIALLAHDKKKELMVQILHCVINLFGKTFSFVQRALRKACNRGLRISKSLKFLSGSQAGSANKFQEFALYEIDLVLCFEILLPQEAMSQMLWPFKDL